MSSTTRPRWLDLHVLLTTAISGWREKSIDVKTPTTAIPLHGMVRISRVRAVLDHIKLYRYSLNNSPAAETAKKNRTQYPTKK